MEVDRSLFLLLLLPNSSLEREDELVEVYLEEREYSEEGLYLRGLRWGDFLPTKRRSNKMEE